MGELIEKLGIHWGLLVAQIVNFLIIMGVLTAFIYKPILRALDERTARVKNAAETAKNIEAEKKNFEHLRREKLDHLDRERSVILAEAKAEAKKVHAELISKAEAEAEQIILNGRKQIEREREQAVHELQSQATVLVLKLTEKILQREFSDTDQKRLLQDLERDIPSLIS